MKAAVYKGKQRFSVDEIPTPEPGPGQVLVKVKYSAICGTDVHAFLYDRARPGTIMGHEYSGTVAELGPGVSTWSVGDRVVGLGGAFPSGMGPRYVVDPRFNYREMGYEVSHNGYAEYVVAEEWQPAAIPDGVSDEAAALAEPCGVAVRAVRNSALRLGDTVAVIGAGPIGMFCVQAARAAGASAVFVSEPAPARAEAALSAGADAVFDPTTEDVVAKVAEATGGLGPHVAFECVGVGKTLDQAMDMVRQSGQVVLVGVAWEETPLLPSVWMAKEIKLQTTFGARSEDYCLALDLIKTGKIAIEPMVSKAGFIPLDDIQEAFEALVKPTTQLQMVLEL